jgi:hypothetical protein
LFYFRTQYIENKTFESENERHGIRRNLSSDNPAFRKWPGAMCFVIFNLFLFLCPKKFGNQAHKSHSCTALQFLKWLYFSGTQLRPWLGAETNSLRQ